uniref:Dendritic cell-specific transmembrane protein-like domain-containing protein n=1 Tax=Strongyloides stercoralis TaxID=6248 RepID=A0AAF5DIT6_STRER
MDNQTKKLSITQCQNQKSLSPSAFTPSSTINETKTFNSIQLDIPSKSIISASPILAEKLSKAISSDLQINKEMEEKLLTLTRENNLLRSKLELQGLPSTPRLSFSDSTHLPFSQGNNLDPNSPFNTLSYLPTINPTTFFTTNTQSLQLPTNSSVGLSYGPAMPQQSQTSINLQNINGRNDYIDSNIPLFIPSVLKPANSLTNILRNPDSSIFQYDQRNNSLQSILENGVKLHGTTNSQLSTLAHFNNINNIKDDTLEQTKTLSTSQQTSCTIPSLLSTLLSTTRKSPSVQQSRTEQQSGLFIPNGGKENTLESLTINMNNSINKMDVESSGSPHSISDSNHSQASPTNSRDSSGSNCNGYKGDYQKYIDRRRRNNEAAKRCRANRRAVFEYRSKRALQLEQENEQLKQEIIKLNNDLCTLKAMLAGQESNNN